MPNWCENILIIEGYPQSVREFKKRVKGKGTALSLDKLHPMPKELEDTVVPDDKTNWYAWCNDNWGTKWDVKAKLVDEHDLECEFEIVTLDEVHARMKSGKRAARQFATFTFDDG